MPTTIQHNFREISRIVFPALTAIFLFIFISFFLFLPRFEQSLIVEKKVMLKELVHSSWHIIEHLDQEVRLGKSSLESAQQTALDLLREMRYGDDGKDYFWVNDFSPALIMHPYRPELERQDMSHFTDPAGIKLFMEFVKMVSQNGQGYVPYMWQWKDDPSRIVPKLSYVKEYKPWGWIIGTGIYMEDLEAEVAAMTRNLIIASIIILSIVSLLAWYQIYQAFHSMKMRQRVEAELLDYKDQLEITVKTRTVELSKANTELKKALGEVKTLNGLIPICASCKGIRDDSGYWSKIETYISAHTEAEFSHGICPSCAKKLYPDEVDENGEFLPPRSTT